MQWYLQLLTVRAGRLGCRRGYDEYWSTEKGQGNKKTEEGEGGWQEVSNGEEWVKMNEREDGGADEKMVRSPMFVHTPSMDRTGVFDDDVVQMKMLPKSLAN